MVIISLSSSSFHVISLSPSPTLFTEGDVPAPPFVNSSELTENGRKVLKAIALAPLAVRNIKDRDTHLGVINKRKGARVHGFAAFGGTGRVAFVFE